MKEEALKLADELNLISGMISLGDKIKWGQDSELMVQGSDMIRKLVAELDDSKALVDKYCKRNVELQGKITKLLAELDKQRQHNLLMGALEKSSTKIERPQTKPLSDEEIHDIWKNLWESGNIGHIAYLYARAIEERHGVK